MCVCVRVRIRTRTHTHVCMCTRTYTYAYTYTRVRALALGIYRPTLPFSSRATLEGELSSLSAPACARITTRACYSRSDFKTSYLLVMTMHAHVYAHVRAYKYAHASVYTRVHPHSKTSARFCFIQRPPLLSLRMKTSLTYVSRGLYVSCLDI